MITPELIAYIRAEEARGVSRDTIQRTLMAQGGWEFKNLHEAFASLAPVEKFSSPSPPPVTQSPPATEPLPPVLQIVTAPILAPTPTPKILPPVLRSWPPASLDAPLASPTPTVASVAVLAPKPLAVTPLPQATVSRGATSSFPLALVIFTLSLVLIGIFALAVVFGVFDFVTLPS